MTNTTDEPFLYGINDNSINKRLKYLEITKDPLIIDDSIPEIVNAKMNKSNFVNALNSGFDQYADLCLCYRNSFKGFHNTQSWDRIYEIINKNFREYVYYDGLSFDELCYRINKQFTIPIRRFQDAKLNTGVACDFSIDPNWYAHEPSVIVSDDGGTMWLYASGNRWGTHDGIYWSLHDTLNHSITNIHNNVSFIDGVYYDIGVYVRNNEQNLNLHISTDGVNFEFAGTMFRKGTITTQDGYTVELWGNPYLLKEGNTWYLYIESKGVEADGTVTFWLMDIATCTDILYQNEDGTIGNWQWWDGNHLYYGQSYFTSSTNASAGNPDFFKGMDNRPIKLNGYYYMLWHCTTPQGTNETYGGYQSLMRSKSKDLLNWEIEGPMLRNLDVPTHGDKYAGNGDQCIIEFKGRTYLFYTFDINYTGDDPYIKYVIDDRPIIELLKLLP